MNDRRNRQISAGCGVVLAPCITNGWLRTALARVRLVRLREHDWQMLRRKLINTHMPEQVQIFECRMWCSVCGMRIVIGLSRSAMWALGFEVPAPAGPDRGAGSHHNEEGCDGSAEV